MPRKDRDDVDDDDDRPRPRPRRRRPRDDDDDDEPSAEKAGGPNKLVILAVGLGVLGLVGLVCGGVLVARYLATPAKVPVQNPAQGGGAGAPVDPSQNPELEAKNRNTTLNNMKQIAIGMHNQNDAEGAFQGPFAPGAVNGGHSFRVGLLPYLEQRALFDRIDLKQPWDSERNVLITNAIVPGYLDPTNPAPLGTATPYRLFVGPGAVFEGKGVMPKILSITDGTSNTILYVQATETVSWAKPQELPYGRGIPLPPLGSPQADGFFMAMADGSVRYLKRKASEATLRSLIEKADGRGAGLE